MGIEQSIADSLGRISMALVSNGMSDAAATEATDLYAKFLELAALYPSETICPPAAADEAWHTHLSMGSYASDCQKVCGRVLGHDATAFGTSAFRAAWARTRDLFRQHFGIVLVSNPDAEGQGALAPATCFILQAAA